MISTQDEPVETKWLPENKQSMGVGRSMGFINQKEHMGIWNYIYTCTYSLQSEEIQQVPRKDEGQVGSLAEPS